MRIEKDRLIGLFYTYVRIFMHRVRRVDRTIGIHYNKINP